MPKPSWGMPKAASHNKQAFSPLMGAGLGALGGAGLGALTTDKDKDESTLGNALTYGLGGAALGGLGTMAYNAYNAPGEPEQLPFSPLKPENNPVLNPAAAAMEKFRNPFGELLTQQAAAHPAHQSAPVRYPGDIIGKLNQPQPAPGPHKAMQIPGMPNMLGSRT